MAVNGQKKFDLIVNETSLELEEKILTGYASMFDFTREEVRKGWWKYARQFGNPVDMREYYKVKIPSQTTDGNVDLTIFAQTLGEGGTVTFKIGLEEKKYKVQVEELLKVFKKDLYIQYYLAELKLKELEAEKYTSQYESALDDEKYSILDSLTSKKREIELLKDEIRKLEKG